MDLRALLLVIGVAIAGGPAEAQSLKLTGTAGVLSEWQLAGDVTETGPNLLNNPGKSIFRYPGRRCRQNSRPQFGSKARNARTRAH
jgi:hypothetical protein